MLEVILYLVVVYHGSPDEHFYRVESHEECMITSEEMIRRKEVKLVACIMEDSGEQI